MSVLLRPGAGRGGSEEEAEKWPRVQPDNQVNPTGVTCWASPFPALCSLLLKASVTSGCSVCPPRVHTYPKEKFSVENLEKLHLHD